MNVMVILVIDVDPFNFKRNTVSDRLINIDCICTIRICTGILTNVNINYVGIHIKNSMNTYKLHRLYTLNNLESIYS